jgi:hypothetical protein
MSVRSEPRTVRPYQLPPELSGFLDEVSLRLGDAVLEPGTHKVDESAMLVEDLVLELPEQGAALVEAVRAAELEPDDVHLVVLAYARPMRRCRILMRSPVGAAVEGPVSIGRDIDELLFGSQRGFDLRAALVLAREQPRRPLRVWQAGTWLSRADFGVRPEARRSALNPALLTKEIRQQFKIPAETLWWIRLNATGEDLLQAGSLEEAVSIYLDEQVYNMMIEEDEDPVGMFLQSLLGVDVLMDLATALVGAAREVMGGDVSYSDLEPWAFPQQTFRQIAATIERPTLAVFDWAASGGSELRSHLQSAFGAMSISKAALKGVR